MWEITAERKKHAETQGQKEAREERGEGEIDIGRGKDTERQKSRREVVPEMLEFPWKALRKHDIAVARELRGEQTDTPSTKVFNTNLHVFVCILSSVRRQDKEGKEIWRGSLPTQFWQHRLQRTLLQVRLRSKGTSDSPDSEAKAASIQRWGITPLPPMMALRRVTQV